MYSAEVCLADFFAGRNSLEAGRDSVGWHGGFCGRVPSNCMPHSPQSCDLSLLLDIGVVLSYVRCFTLLAATS